MNILSRQAANKKFEKELEKTEELGHLKVSDLVPLTEANTEELVPVKSLSQARLAAYVDNREQDQSELSTLLAQKEKLEEDISNLQRCIAASEAAEKLLLEKTPVAATNRLKVLAEGSKP